MTNNKSQPKALILSTFFSHVVLMVMSWWWCHEVVVVDMTSPSRTSWWWCRNGDVMMVMSFNCYVSLNFFIYLSVRLELDIKRLKSDLQLSRNTEQELRSQIAVLSASDKMSKSELNQLRQDNENLQSKYVRFFDTVWYFTTNLLSNSFSRLFVENVLIGLSKNLFFVNTKLQKLDVDIFIQIQIQIVVWIAEHDIGSTDIFRMIRFLQMEKFVFSRFFFPS